MRAFAQTLINKARLVLKPEVDLYREGLEHAQVIENALATNSVELVRDHIDRLCEIIEERELEAIAFNTRTNMGGFLKQLPEYQEVIEFIESVPDEHLKSHLNQLINQGETYHGY